MAKRSFPLSKVYRLLEPGPVVLLTTMHKGRANVMTMSWHTMMEFEPPLVGCVVSGRDFSFDALRATRQCTLNIPTAELARAGRFHGGRRDDQAAVEDEVATAVGVSPPRMNQPGYFMKTPPDTTYALMQGRCNASEPGTFCTVGLLGRWRPLCGHLRHARLANRHGYWLRRSSRNWLANRLAIIPSPS